MTKHQHDELEDKLGSLDEFMHSPSDRHFETTRVSRHGRSDVPLSLYRKIALAFISITGALLIIMLLLTSSNATITVTPKKETVSNTLIRTIGSSIDKIDGVVITEDFDVSKSASVEKGREVESFAKGTITVINTTGEAMAFVPKTRFQSSEGIIFRITQRADIPANGKVDVVVVSDIKGKTGEVGAQKFTIPGLTAAKQKVVYGESKAPMTGGIRVAGVVTEQDVTKLENDTLKEMQDSKVKQFASKEEAAKFSDRVIKVEWLNKKTDATVGSEVDSFTLSGKMRVTAVFFDGKAIDSASRQAVYAKVPDGMKLQSVGTTAYEIEKIDIAAKTASLKITREGVMVLDESSSLLNPENFVDKTEKEINEGLSETGHVEKIDVKLRPRWRSTTPGSEDAITIKLEEVQ